MRLGVVLTFGMSLNEWQKAGILDRELAIYRDLRRQGDQVTFLTYDELDRGFAEKLGFSAIAVCPRTAGSMKRYLRSFIWPLTHRKKLREFECFKTNQMWGSWVGVLAAWVSRRPLVVRCGFELLQLHERQPTSWGRKQFIRLISILAYRYCMRIVMTSEADAEFVRQRFGVSKEKIEIIPNAIDVERFKPRADSAARARWISVARLSAEKNLDLLIRAAAETGCPGDIVGDGPERPHLERLAVSLGAPIRFLGICPNAKLPELLREYSVFALPSKFESSPKALLEAMSCGLTVIGTNVPGIREIIIDGQNGRLVEPEDLARVLKEVMHNQADLGPAARKTIEGRFALLQISKKEKQVFLNILNAGAA